MEWPDWTGLTVACIATGPSLTPEQVATTDGLKRIGINNVGLHYPVDIWYAADYKFWTVYRDRITGSAMTVCADADMLSHEFRTDKYVDVRDRQKAAAFEKGYVVNGGHSGLQALSLAISLGAKRILLLGYDCRMRGQTNYFGRKDPALDKPSPYEDWPRHYRNLKLPPGVEVVNCTPGSAIDAFPFA